MTLNRSYAAELEVLILDTLLPIFDKYYEERGLEPEYSKFNPDLIKQLHKKAQTPRLFLPKK